MTVNDTNSSSPIKIYLTFVIDNSINATSLAVILWFACFFLAASRIVSFWKYRMHWKTKSTFPHIARPTYRGWWINRLPRSHIRELATLWSGRRWSGGSLVEQMFDRCRFIRCDWKTFDGFLRFCSHAWFSDDFLQPRCFPCDLYAVNVVRASSSLALSSAFSSRPRMRRDHEKSFPGCCEVVPVFAKSTCEFAMMQLPLVIPAWSHRRRCVTRVFRNLFKFLPQHSLRGRMISVVTAHVQSPLKIITHR